MKEILEELRESSLFYWRDGATSFKCVATLLGANTALIVIARYPFHGWDKPIVFVLAELLGYLILFMGCVGALFRPGSEMPQDAYKLARTICIVWLLSLMLVSLALLPPVRPVLNYLPDWGNSAIVTAGATGLFLFYSLSKIQNLPLNKRSIILPTLFVALVTWLFFWSTIVDDTTNEFLKETGSKLSAMLQK